MRFSLLSTFYFFVTSYSFGQLITTQNLSFGVGGYQHLEEPKHILNSPDGVHQYIFTPYFIVGFERDGETGELTYFDPSIDWAYPLGGATGVVISPDGLYIYLIGPSGKSLYTINRSAETGKLSLQHKIDDELFSMKAIGMSTDGHFLYVSHGSVQEGGITVFSREISSGILSSNQSLSYVEISESIGAVSGAAGSMLMSPDGKNLYALCEKEYGLLGFQVGKPDGIITPIQMINEDSTEVNWAMLEHMGISEDGVELKLRSGLGETIVNYTRNPDTGWLTYADHGAAIESELASINSQYIMELKNDRLDASMLPINYENQDDSTLQLTQYFRNDAIGIDEESSLNSFPLWPEDQQFVISGLDSNSVAQYLIDPVTGSLTLVQSFYYGDPDSLNFEKSNHDLVISQDKKYLYAYSKQNSILTCFALDAKDSSSSIERIFDFEAGEEGCMGVSPDGSHLYVFSSGVIDVFDVTQGGSLSRLFSINMDYIRGISDVTFNSDGSLVFLSDITEDEIFIFKRNKIDGKLTLTSIVHNDVLGISGLGHVTKVDISNNGRFLYALSRSDDSPEGNNYLIVANIVKQADTTYLSLIQSPQSVFGGNDIVESPGGKFIHVMGEEHYGFTVGDDGVLTPYYPEYTNLPVGDIHFFTDEWFYDTNISAELQNNHTNDTLLHEIKLSGQVTGSNPFMMYPGQVIASPAEDKLTFNLSKVNNSLDSIVNIDAPTIDYVTIESISEATVHWTQPLYIENYEFEYSSDVNFTSDVNSITGISADSMSFPLDHLQAGTMYFIRLRSQGLGQISEWSDTHSFRTLLSVPNNLVVEDITTSSAILEFNEVSGGEHYTAMVSSDHFVTFNQYSSSTSPIHLEHLDTETSYQVFMNASWLVGGVSQYTEHSDTISFTTKSDEEIVLSPPSGLNVFDKSATSIKVVWEAVQEADSYRVEISRDDFNSLLEVVNYSFGQTIAEFNGLIPAGTYQIRVRARSSIFHSEYTKIEATTKSLDNQENEDESGDIHGGVGDIEDDNESDEGSGDNNSDVGETTEEGDSDGEVAEEENDGVEPGEELEEDLENAEEELEEETSDNKTEGVATDESESSELFFLYPTINYGEPLTYKLPDGEVAEKLTLLNTNGKVWPIDLNTLKSNTIQTQRFQLKAGVYILVVETQHAIYRRRIIIK